MYLRSSVLLAMLAWCCATPLVVLPPQEASPTLLLALPSQELEGPKDKIPPKIIVLEQFTWTDEPAGGDLRVGDGPVPGKLEVCTDDTNEFYPGLQLPSDDTIHIVIMIRKDDDATLMEYQGEIKTKQCAEFDLASNPISEESQKYTMVSKNKDGTPIRKGSATFSLQLTSVQFSCNEKDMVRTNNVGGLPVPLAGKKCLKFSDDSEQNGVCYVEGLTITADVPLCATLADSVPPGVVVCQTYVEGTKLEDEPFEDISLVYTEDGSSKSLSYVFDAVVGVVSSSETIMRVDGDVSKVYAGTAKGFPLDDKPNDSKYEVCAISLKGAADTAQPSAVSAGQIQDCNLISYNDKGLMEFGFNNHNEAATKLYVANSIDDDVTNAKIGTVKMDCTEVNTDTTCYGFLNVKDILTKGRLELTYDVEGVIKNKIVTTFKHVDE